MEILTWSVLYCDVLEITLYHYITDIILIQKLHKFAFYVS